MADSRRGDEPALARDLRSVQTRIDQLRRGADETDLLDAYLVDLQNVHEELRVADEEIRTQQEELDRLLRVEVGSDSDRIVAALPAAVLLTDAASTIRAANPAAVELLGVGEAILREKPFLAVVDPADRRTLRDQLRRVGKAGDGFRTTLTVRVPARPPVRVEALTRAVVGPRRQGLVLAWLLLEPSSADAEMSSSGGWSLATALWELIRVPLETTRKTDVATRLAAIAAQALELPASVTVTVGRPSSPEHLGCDSSRAEGLHTAQVAAGEGPSHTAWLFRQPVLSLALPTDRRWPRLSKRIDDRDVGTVLAVPILRDERPVGTFTVYTNPGHRLGDRHLRLCQLLAKTVGAVLQEVGQKAELRSLAAQLQDELASRAVIDQARGMIMMRDRCDADTASATLLALSSRNDVEPRVIAQQIVDAAPEL